VHCAFALHRIEGQEQVGFGADGCRVGVVHALERNCCVVIPYPIVEEWLKGIASRAVTKTPTAEVGIFS
jgi:hypothetical protein